MSNNDFIYFVRQDIFKGLIHSEDEIIKLCALKSAFTLNLLLREWRRHVEAVSSPPMR